VLSLRIFQLALDLGGGIGLAGGVKKAARFLLVCSLMVSIGAQWALLQGVAWVGMAVTYSVQDGSVAEGLSKTFDGEHPCPLCKMVKKGVEDDQGPAQESKGGKGKAKAEFCLTEHVRVDAPAATRQGILRESQQAEVLMMAPEGRPPKAIA
jgi:hypothetical protein